MENWNAARSYCFEKGISCSAMVKDFYASLRIQDFAEKYWGASVEGSFNYLLNNSEVGFHKGGVLMFPEEVDLVGYDAISQEVDFKGFVPVNLLDNREGMSMEDAIQFKEFCKPFENSYFKLDGVMITGGCLHDTVPTPRELEAMVTTLKKHGFTYISLGGSYFMQWVIDGVMPACVNEIRIGEYIICGTIPFLKTSIPSELIGEPSIKVGLEILNVYPYRNQVLLSGGSQEFNVKGISIDNPNFEYVDMSTEYTICSYKEKPEIGEEVIVTPDYHSLVKFLK
jgi:hypothetical protein